MSDCASFLFFSSHLRLLCSIEQKYLALSAFHALVKYTEYAQSYSYASKSCRIEYKCPTAYIQLDGMTTAGLELVRNLRDSKNKKGSLFGTINYCSTSMGLRYVACVCVCVCVCVCLRASLSLSVFLCACVPLLSPVSVYFWVSFVHPTCVG